MAWKGLDVLDEDSSPGSFGRRTTHAATNANCLARDLAHERTEDQLGGWVRGVEHVEACPVDSGRGRGRGEAVVEVPEQRGRVGRVGDPVALVGEEGGQRVKQLRVRFALAERGREVCGVGVRLCVDRECWLLWVDSQAEHE